MKALSLKKKRLAKTKMSQLLFDLEFDERQCLYVFVPLKVEESVGQDFDHSLIKLVILSINSKVDLGPLI